MDPTRRTDPEYLRRHQYADSRNLDARFQLHDRFSANQYGWHEWVFDHLDLPAEARILELGCGQGFFWQKNAARLPARWAPVLTDLSPGMLADAHRALAVLPLDHLDAPIRLVNADARHLPWPDDQFDAVMANHMLYHVPDRPLALAEIRRVLRPDGRLYAATNGVGHLAQLHRLANDVYGETNPAGAGHWGFSLENGAAQLKAHFQQVDLDRYDDHLAVTDPEAVVAFVRSVRDLPPDRERDLRRRLTRCFDADGAFTIAKDSGLFIASP